MPGALGYYFLGVGKEPLYFWLFALIYCASQRKLDFCEYYMIFRRISVSSFFNMGFLTIFIILFTIGCTQANQNPANSRVEVSEAGRLVAENQAAGSQEADSQAASSQAAATQAGDSQAKGGQGDGSQDGDPQAAATQGGESQAKGSPTATSQAIDSQAAAAQRRAQDIRYDLMAFARTGEYGFLCHAAMLGSKEAAERLERDRLSCSYR